MRFIYVTSMSDKEALEKIGYKLLKTDERNKLWIFDAMSVANCELNGVTFAQLGIRVFFSDTMTF